MSERFAIYYAPAASSTLWTLGAQWLGRDPASGALFDGDVAGLPRAHLAGLSASARRYGLHATFKAPFALAGGTSRGELEAALATFAADHPQVPIGRLRLALIDGFLALVPERQGEALTRLAADCVAGFDRFRRAMPAEERRRRIEGGLSGRQIELLDRYGYPYVMDQFRFHMTLTDRLAEADRDEVKAAAGDWFAPALDAPLQLDRLALFRQPGANAVFVREADFLLGAEETAIA